MPEGSGLSVDHGTPAPSSRVSSSPSRWMQVGSQEEPEADAVPSGEACVEGRIHSANSGLGSSSRSSEREGALNTNASADVRHCVTSARASARRPLALAAGTPALS